MRRKKIGAAEISELELYGATVGIDLGTSNSSIGVWLPTGRVEVIGNSSGRKVTPSCVAFLESETLVGHEALEQVEINRLNTVFEAKRFLGKHFADDSVQDDIRYNSSKVAVVDGRPHFAIERQGEVTMYSPEQISAEIMVVLKTHAEMYLKQKVLRAVVTVPAYFGQAQREATKAAAQLAGIEVMRILNEPTAAALAYQLDNGFEGSRKLMVFDLGGGTFDVSILEVVGDIFEVRATYGNTRLGGSDFDKRLMEHCAQEVNQKHGIDLLEIPQASRRLRAACERAKIALSTEKETAIEIDSIAEGIDIDVGLSRQQFESICKDLFNEIIDTVDRAVRAAGLSNSEISDIVLVGGSSAIPKLHTDLQAKFDGPQQRLQKHLDPNEAVVRGAALQAAALAAIEGKPQRVLLLDATPLPLGVETAGKALTTVVEANAMIPCERSLVFTTAADNQTKMLIRVVEGERLLSRHKDNYVLHKFYLDDIPPAPRGVPQIEITFALDFDGLLSLSALDLLTGHSVKAKISMDLNRVDKDGLRRMRLKAEEAADKERAEVAKIDAKNALQCYAHRLQAAMTDADLCVRLGATGEATVRGKTDETVSWLEQMEQVAGTAELIEKQQELEAVVLPAMASTCHDR